ncbi:esterase/lipase family protein [uncultured Celeribacter sp.]|uniref:esterase/lipase family protein n=1 Tax=uncultured Celeribacter sp. TaxID=1303376 RepID=UPI00374A65CE
MLRFSKIECLKFFEKRFRLWYPQGGKWTGAHWAPLFLSRAFGHVIPTKILFYALVFSGLPLPLVAVSSVDAEPRCVILLHGLARTDASMLVMEQALQAAGYTVVNQGYPLARGAPG